MGRFLIILLTFSLAFSINAQSVIWDSDDTDVLYDGINNVLPLKFIDVDIKNIDVDQNNCDYSNIVSGLEVLHNWLLSI